MDDAGLDLTVIPEVAKRFAEAMQTRTETDSIDAHARLQTWQCMDALVLTSRACARTLLPPSTSSEPRPETSSRPLDPLRRHQTS